MNGIINYINGNTPIPNGKPLHSKTLPQQINLPHPISQNALFFSLHFKTITTRSNNLKHNSSNQQQQRRQSKHKYQT